MWAEIALLVILIFLLKKHFSKPPGMPPGDWGWPIVGKLPSKGQSLLNFFNEQRKKHGDIFCVKMGSRIIVFLCKFKDIKNVFTKPEFNGRPDFYTLLFSRKFKPAGYLMATGDLWRQNRRFALSHLRDLGMGKNVMNSIIEKEVECLVNDLEKNLNKPVSIQWKLNMAIFNVIWGLLASDHYENDDEKFKAFFEGLNRNLKLNDGPVSILNYFPWLDYCLPKVFKNKYLSIGEISKNIEQIHTFLQNTIDEHKKSLDIENPRDLLDMYLIDMKTNKLPEIFDDHNLLLSMYDMFIAGQETTSSTLRWFFLYMATHQNVQSKIHQEIKDAVPNERFPSLDDKEKLPYLEATIHEVNRIASFVPFNLFHQANTDAPLNEYILPKGTIVLGGSIMCHFDPDYWKNPTEFQPDRFLDNGKFCLPKEGYLPFSVGQRQCLGESFAKMELFLFSAAILQRFQLSPPNGEILPMDADPSSDMFRFTKPFEIVIEKRC